MNHSLSRYLFTSLSKRARMSLTRGSSTGLNSRPGLTANSRRRTSSTTSPKMGIIERRSSKPCPPACTSCLHHSETQSTHTDLRCPLNPVRHHSMTAPNILLWTFRSTIASSSLRQAGTSLRMRADHAWMICLYCFESRSAKARRTRLYSWRNTVRLSSSSSASRAGAHRAAISVISRASRRRFLLTAMDWRKYGPQSSVLALLVSPPGTLEETKSDFAALWKS
mmetsp:Transcript_42666/g.122467  ORF Transcript_42666/g.122467 Transcript_42666/m.122467 type:complete len:224 (+) Transcript_42666:899-1570(+)